MSLPSPPCNMPSPPLTASLMPFDAFYVCCKISTRKNKTEGEERLDSKMQPACAAKLQEERRNETSRSPHTTVGPLVAAAQAAPPTENRWGQHKETLKQRMKSTQPFFVRSLPRSLAPPHCCDFEVSPKTLALPSTDTLAFSGQTVDLLQPPPLTAQPRRAVGI